MSDDSIVQIVSIVVWGGVICFVLYGVYKFIMNELK